MAKYFRVTITTQLISTFKVSYSTISNPSVFNHTADIWAETTPYSPATGLTYDQLTDNGGLIVVTDDDVYKINIEDENNYCTDCISNSFGVAQLTYSLTSLRLDYSVSYQTQVETTDSYGNPSYEDHSANGDSYSGTGTYYPPDGNPFDSFTPSETFSLSPIISGVSSGTGETANLHNTSSLYYEFDNYDDNNNFLGKYRAYGIDDYTYDFNNSDTDFSGNGGSFSFDAFDTQYIAAGLRYTASFTTGTNVTMSMAVWTDSTSPYTGTPPDGLAEADGWTVFWDEHLAIEDGTTGKWKFSGEAESGYSDYNSYIYVKPVIMVPSDF